MEHTNASVEGVLEQFGATNAAIARRFGWPVRLLILVVLGAPAFFGLWQTVASIF